MSNTARLRELERTATLTGREPRARKLELLRELESARLPSARSVLRLHEVLCFLRAYPDDAEVLEQVERLLEAFASRADLRTYRAGLADTGIAGTDIHFAFFAAMSLWLAQRWPERFEVDWSATEGGDRLKGWLEPLLLDAEVPAFYDLEQGARAWVDELKHPDETDGVFLARSFDALLASPSVRRLAFDDLGITFRLRGSADGPSRTRAKYAGSPIVHQERPLVRGRPVLAEAVREKPGSIRALSRREGRVLIDLAREAMAVRSRDLDSFAFGDPDDVRMVDWGDGLQFACIGIVPEQRIVLEGLYAFLTLKNGVPIGYVLASALCESSEIAYNVFDTYRGAEAGHVYGRVLATVRALFGTDTFTVFPYQLGHGNAEGIASGAWWFYQKLGFRARDEEVLALMRTELAAMRRDPEHRTSRAVLKRLARRNVFWSLGKQRDDVIGVLSFERISLAVTRYVSERFGSRRRRAVPEMTREATRLLDARPATWRPAERRALARWSPLVLCLGVDRWPTADRRALARIVRAKGGRRESDYVALFDRHRRLRRALVRLSG